MRNQLVAAFVGLFAASSANAAIWTFDVGGTFDFSAYEYRTICADFTPSCVATTETRGPVDVLYRISLPSFVDMSDTAYTSFPVFGGVAFDPGRSLMETILRFDNGNYIVDRAQFSGSYNPQGCYPGPNACYSSIGGATPVNVGVVFVSSTDATVPVPEPTIWAMMIGGFGLIGGIQRMRRRISALRFPDVRAASTLSRPASP